MKVVMINDCSFVGETLTKYFSEDSNVVHLKRTKGLFDKTVKICWRILRSNGDVYHCHYLLQDCWLALRLGKHPIVGHAHGSDLRDSIKRFVLGRIVRHNLKNCDKIVVSTPNLLKTARKYNKSAEYVPNLVNESIFCVRVPRETEEKIRILIASASDWSLRGTDKIIKALKKIERNVEVSIVEYGVDINRTLKLAKLLGLHMKVLPPVPHSDMPKYYWSADVVIGPIGVGGSIGMVALEAIACGRPVITHVSSKFTEYEAFPLLDIFTPKDIADAVLSLRDENVWEKQYEYFKTYHNPENVVRKFMKIYDDLIELKKCD